MELSEEMIVVEPAAKVREAGVRACLMGGDEEATGAAGEREEVVQRRRREGDGLLAQDVRAGAQGEVCLGVMYTARGAEDDEIWRVVCEEVGIERGVSRQARKPHIPLILFKFTITKAGIDEPDE